MNSVTLIGLAADHLWQSIVLALVLYLAFRAAHDWTAAARYRLALAAFAATAILPLYAVLPWVPWRFAAQVDWISLTPSFDQAVSSPVIVDVASSDLLQNPARQLMVLSWSLQVTWGCGALFLLVRVALEGIHMWRLIRGATRINEVTQQGLAIATTTGIAGPMVVGYFRPLILLPCGTEELQPQHHRALLAHEQAHVLRGDTTVALLQRLLIAIFWWSPALRWINARIDEEREMACDAFAAAQIGDPAIFAQALIEHARGRVDDGLPALAMSAVRLGSSLARRVERLLLIKPGRSCGAGDIGVVSACVVVVLCVAAGTPPLGDAPAHPVAAPEAAGSPISVVAPTGMASPRGARAMAIPVTSRRKSAHPDHIAPSTPPAMNTVLNLSGTEQAALDARFDHFKDLAETYRGYDLLAEKFRSFDSLAAKYDADHYPPTPPRLPNGA